MFTSCWPGTFHWSLCECDPLVRIQCHSGKKQKFAPFASSKMYQVNACVIWAQKRHSSARLYTQREETLTQSLTTLSHSVTHTLTHMHIQGITFYTGEIRSNILWDSRSNTHSHRQHIWPVSDASKVWSSSASLSSHLQKGAAVKRVPMMQV